MNKSELKKYLKENKSQKKKIKDGYKSERPSFKARAKKIVQNIGKNTKNWFINGGKRIKLAGVNIKKNVKDFIDTRQNYDELKKKYEYVISSLKVLKANGSTKKVNFFKEIENILDNV